MEDNLYGEPPEPSAIYEEPPQVSLGSRGPHQGWMYVGEHGLSHP